MPRARANALICVGVLFAITMVWFASLGAAPPHPARRAETTTPAGVAARLKIKHVVVIVQENRTFDNLFGGYALAPVGGPLAYPRADSTYPPEVVAKMRPAGFDAAHTPGDASHDAYACLNEALPSQPRFSSQRWISVSTPPAPASCPNAGSFFLYVPTSQRAVYWEIANAYGLGDRFFAATTSASFPPHQFIVAGDLSITWPQKGGRVWHISEDPYYSCFGANSGSHTLQVVGPNVFSIPLHIDGPEGGCYNRLTYGDRLTQANATWRHYTTALPAGGGPFPFDGFSNIAQWYEQTVNLPTAQFIGSTKILDDAKSPLPNFVWVKPPCTKQSDHPGAGQGHHGPNWVGSVINAIGKGPNWDSTVIFVIWDDWGGFYDHVIPPVTDPTSEELGRGVRIPFLVISPYLAHPGGVVHTPGHPGSIMRFVDDLYGLTPLTAFDRQAPDLAGWFDFTQPPRRFVPIAGAVGNGKVWDDTWCDGKVMIKVD